MPSICAGTHRLELRHQPGSGIAAEDAGREVGLGVERTADAHHVGLAPIEDRR